MTTTESKGEMTTAQKIIADDFSGNIPTLEEVLAKFPPIIEMFETKDKKTIFFRKVSRNESGVMLYFIPPTDRELAGENLIFRLKKRLAQAKQKA